MIKPKHLPAPQNTHELMQRVQAIAGLTIGELAAKLQLITPANLRQHKGWVGQLLEVALGTDAGNRAAPDFIDLQVELKTIPLDNYGQPQESTYVTLVPLLGEPGLCWLTSEVRAKLKQVLWIPIEASQDLPLAKRRIGNGLLWYLPVHVEAILQADWQELMEYVLLGKLAELNASIGQYLHIRPKAANNKALTYGLDPEGHKILTLPRGYYLRPQLTAQIINKKC